MKYLTFIRHAKSDWSTNGQKDFDRSLNERGNRVAPKMGVKLKELNLCPQWVISSPSVRTRATVELVLEQLQYDLETVQYLDELYEASTRNVSETIAKLDNTLQDVVIIGHNPSLSYMCEYLTGEPIDTIPTCGVVRIEFDIETWDLIVKGAGKMKYFIFPSQFNY